jgi:hypothetical protein
MEKVKKAIPWNDGYLLLMAKSVKQSNAHVKCKFWRDAYRMFFNSDEVLKVIYDNNHLLAERKMKDMYMRELKRICDIMGWMGSPHPSNLSAQEAESPSEYYDVIKSIAIDLVEKQEGKDRDTRNRELMSNVTTTLLTTPIQKSRKRAIEDVFDTKTTNSTEVSNYIIYSIY